MTWDNIISRGSWLILQPSNFLILLLILSFIGILLKQHNSHWYKISIRVNLTTLFIISLISFTNLASWIMWPLEARFAEFNKISMSEKYSGIIVLAGAERTIISTHLNQPTFSNAGERLYQTVNVARKFPYLPLIHSGGVIRNPSVWSENDVAEKFFHNNEIDLSRIRFDAQSYNTFTNAIESKKLFKANEDQKWLLIKSAYHMPRAVGAFQEANINIHPYPVDYRTPLKYYSFFRLSMSENFRTFDLAIHEYLGLIAYYLSGRSKNLFPKMD